MFIHILTVTVSNSNAQQHARFIKILKIQCQSSLVMLVTFEVYKSYSCLKVYELNDEEQSSL